MDWKKPLLEDLGILNEGDAVRQLEPDGSYPSEELPEVSYQSKNWSNKNTQTQNAETSKQPKDKIDISFILDNIVINFKNLTKLFRELSEYKNPRGIIAQVDYVDEGTNYNDINSDEKLEEILNKIKEELIDLYQNLIQLHILSHFETENKRKITLTPEDINDSIEIINSYLNVINIKGKHFPWLNDKSVSGKHKTIQLYYCEMIFLTKKYFDIIKYSGELKKLVSDECIEKNKKEFFDSLSQDCNEIAKSRCYELLTNKDRFGNISENDKSKLRNIIDNTDLECIKKLIDYKKTIKNNNSNLTNQEKDKK